MISRVLSVRLLFRVAVIGFWVVMMGLLYMKEVRPYIGTPGRADEGDLTYRALLQHAEQGPTTMSIYWLGSKVGRTVTTRYRRGNAFQINTRTRISTAALGRLFMNRDNDVPGEYRSGQGDITITADTVVGPEFDLVSFSALVTAGGSGELASVDGRVVDNTLRLIVTDPTGVRRNQRLPFDPHLALTPSPNTPLDARDLAVGVQWRIGTINPLTGRYEKGVAKVVRRETITWNESRHNAYVVKVRWGRMKSTLWVSKDGKVFKQKAPLGIVLLRAPPQSGSTPGQEE